VGWGNDVLALLQTKKRAAGNPTALITPTFQRLSQTTCASLLAMAIPHAMSKEAEVSISCYSSLMGARGE